MKTKKKVALSSQAVQSFIRLLSPCRLNKPCHNFPRGHQSDSVDNFMPPDTEHLGADPDHILMPHGRCSFLSCRDALTYTTRNKTNACAWLVSPHDIEDLRIARQPMSAVQFHGKY